MSIFLKRGVWVLLLFASCTEKTNRVVNVINFDSLLEVQVQQLSQRKRVLDKTASLSGTESDTTLVPSTQVWEAELEIFKQLQNVNKPTYKDAYVLTDGIADANSNLTIRQYLASAAPVSSLQFYYQDDFAQLKKVEAIISEHNMLRTTHRNLTLEFEEEDGRPVLNRYAIKGFQKLVFTDTVRFAIEGQIDW
ncbi:MAG: hypothetical protein K2U26_20465 [Cyclobacteriaceae bacterium]|nr:hypothetical protein [Cyclobacteriaceae bacterium]